MATVLQSIDSVTAWVQEHVCEHFRLKLPTDQLTATGDVTVVAPRAYSMYLPQTDEATSPSDRPTHPSVLVQLLPSSDTRQDQRELQIRLSFTTYSIGTQQGELYVPADDAGQPADGTISQSFRKLDPTEWQQPHYRRNEEGWRDAWNMIDYALREIEQATQIGLLRLDRSKAIEFGPYSSDDDPIWTYYPYWGGWITFWLTGDPPNENWDTLSRL